MLWMPWRDRQSAQGPPRSWPGEPCSPSTVPQSLSHVRRRNLLLQLRLHGHRAVDAGQGKGAEASFAELIGMHKSLLSKLKGESPSGRDVSDSLARQIEAALALRPGWMDEEHEDAPPTSAEKSFLVMALKAYRATDAAGRTQLRKLMQKVGETGQGP